jgi:transcriptional regulator with GAF, ATPase, and Fis domain
VVGNLLERGRSVDDLSFEARRATSGARSEPDVEARFKILVQSPLRAGILRFLAARPKEAFDTEALMQTFGRMRLDVENCVRELVEFGVVRRNQTDPPTYAAARPDGPAAELLDTFLERRAHIGVEEASPSVQRFREMIGRDEKMLAIFEWIRTAAKSDISVLILGPTGAGKEVVARMIHELSRRGQEKFQAVNCAALPDTLFESEIFGYEKGAFTGAHDRKPGRLEMANGGTLFLDEVGDLSLVAQAKLLRVLEERRFERLGGNRSISVDFRLISATNRPLDMFVRESRFREDLYYRINAFAIRLPSLRERVIDIPVLANRFLARYCAANGLTLDAKQFAQEAVDQLVSYHWPGNIRELESTVSRAALSAPGRTIRAADIEFLHGPPVARGDEEQTTRLPSLRDAERAHIIRVLESSQWNKLEAARILDISRGTLYRKIDEYGLEPAHGAVRRRARRERDRPEA